MLRRLNDRFPSLLRLMLSPAASTLVALAVVGVMLLAMRPAAASAAVRVDTRLEFDAFGLIYADGSYDYVFAGLVTTPVRGFGTCTARRNVRVFRVVPGPDKLIGARRSNFIGFAPVTWKDPDLAAVPGRYYAEVGGTRRETRRGTVRCDGDRSPTVAVSEPHFHRVRSAGR